jgi:hypothetical protein
MGQRSGSHDDLVAQRAALDQLPAGRKRVAAAEAYLDAQFKRSQQSQHVLAEKPKLAASNVGYKLLRVRALCPVGLLSSFLIICTRQFQFRG